MPKFSVRPSNTSAGLPGNSTSTAHAGKPASHKQAHHKLHQLDPHAAQQELLSPLFDAARAARKYLAQPLPTADAAVAMAPRKSKSVLGQLANKVGTCFGMARGNPVRSEELLRYQNTKEDRTHVPLRSRGKWESLEPVLTGQLKAAETLRLAKIAVDKAIAMERLVEHHHDRLTDEALLRGQRAGHLQATAQRLEREGQSLAVWQAALQEQRQSAQQNLQATQQRLDKALALRADHAKAASTSNRSAAPDGLAEHIEALTALQRTQAGKHAELVRRSQDTRAALEHTDHQIKTAARELLQYESGAFDLQSLKPALAQRRKEAEQQLEHARRRDRIATEALQKAYADIIDLQLRRLPGFEVFRSSPAIGELREALRAWVKDIDATRHGAEAIVPASALTMAIKALADASGGDATVALHTLQTLGGQTWGTLLPDPSAGLGNAPALDAATQRTVDLLVRVPRGSQVVGHLLAPAAEGTPDHTRRHTARLALQAEAAARSAPTQELRDWLAAASRAARKALHGADPAKALAACTHEERSAYHALRNNYRSNAEGSPYDRANQHLQKIADWLHDIDHTADRGVEKSQRGKKINPLRSLPQALEVGSATALPTPRRRAEQELEDAADHLTRYLMAARATRPPDEVPTEAELAWIAVADQVRWAPEGTERATMVLDAALLDGIQAQCAQRQRERALQIGRRAGDPVPAPESTALHSAWEQLRATPHTGVQALALLQRALLNEPAGVAEPEPAPPSPSPLSSSAAALPTDAQQAQAQRKAFHVSVAKALRLLYDGDPSHVTNGQALFDLLRDVAEHLEWRDRLRLMGQKTYGLNLGPLSAAAAIASAVGLGVKLIGSAQHNEDRTLELYRGRTGTYLQISSQSTNQVQAGAGVNTGYAVPLGTDQASLGLTGGADWRWRGERGTENGVQVRIPRLSKGREPELDAQFADALEHLIAMAAPPGDGQPARKDWMRELLAEHPELSIGLIDGAERSSSGTETNVSASVGLRVGEVAGRGRRAGAAASVGVKARQDNGQARTTVAGYMTTIYREATAQMKVEVSGRATLGVQFAESVENDPENGPTQKASASLGLLDAGYSRELVSKAVTHFCTLFVFDDEIDPTRSDRATDVSEFDVFQQLVRDEWDSWSSYGVGKLGTAVDDDLKHAASQLQLEHFMEQTRTFAQGNGLAAMFADKSMKAPAAPALDTLRALARLDGEAASEAFGKACAGYESAAAEFDAAGMDMRSVRADLGKAREALEAGDTAAASQHLDHAAARLERKVIGKTGRSPSQARRRDDGVEHMRQAAQCKEQAVARLEEARISQTGFDDLVVKDELWEPTLLLLREKAKVLRERGLDFFLKRQNNRGAEAMRTVAQWILYEPVLRSEPGQRIEPAGHWKTAAGVPGDGRLASVPEGQEEDAE
ncbi:XopZ family type III secretion system effector [Acidovorax sp. SUPP3334]|uniref:XopZ family type III secretion system effector n=1 Tax=Acidovorax sp. SUPP3334 TaxID=2920881 RepID=UPI0023DE2E5F|nr:XopZ family type III secretion system effector [Acidovorax sp. SUPP3334]GKT24752.1 hypothetical protein AVHM3334_15745 [Acidovorax sp. SUPP3334]